MPLMTEASPDLAVRMLDESLHRISGQEKFTIQPSALEIALPLLGEAGWNNRPNPL